MKANGRDIESLDTFDAIRTPELFWTTSLSPAPEYPLLEIHTEGIHRKVWGLR